MTIFLNEQQRLKDEIRALEEKLHYAKLKLEDSESVSVSILNSIDTHSRSDILVASSLHTLLLLADSALPLGSFAFSSGLESYLAHRKERALVNKTGHIPTQFALLQSFLHLSL